MGKRFRIWLALPLLLATLGNAPALLNPEEYQRISQCVLARERADLAGQKVQLTGTYLEGSPFCHVIRKAGIHTRDYECFALGKPCIVRLYLHKDHPQAELLRSLQNGAKVTAYGVFDFEGSDYNYVILDGIALHQ
ncbi:MAG TPA: hypothetical protein VK997_08495 [Deferrisomatales bacterium]|nr:hypothetical protein [Deferrisomatales bacterium]